VTPLGELTVRWTGGEDLDLDSGLRIDEFEGVPPVDPDPTPAAHDTTDDTTGETP
jgi:segregation and condensation protein A